ncbi:ATP-binding cassette sub-family C member 4-like [Oppia nitens]|uniref:ATP-binding cassette sub-family C member 4-like n=1 Tax=Oppia nitens TaxID=1686743 RepID=UPI0023DCB5FC|nr:ATP-binding cassette sub-family C member 4-like [Oppia nitens]
MDFTKQIVKKNPYDSANIVNRNFFWWINPFLKQGYSNELKVSDLYKCPKVDSSKRLGEKLEKEWDNELETAFHKKRRPSLLRAILRAFGFWYFMSGSISILNEGIIRTLQPIAMGYMVYFMQAYKHTQHIKDPDNDLLNNYYIMAAMIILLGIIYILWYHPYFFKMQRKGMQLRIACCNLVYKKALRLSHKALGRTTVGQMVNLLSNDVNRFDNSFIFIPFIFTAPFQTVVSLAYLYWAGLQWSVLVGCSVLVVYLPFQMYMGRLFSQLRSKTAVLTDERIRLMNEIIPSMRVIKMYTWEKPFAKMVEIARRREVKKIKFTSMLRGVNMALFFVSSKTMILITFVVFVKEIGQIEAQLVFVALSLLNNVRQSLTLFFPYGISQGSEALISIGRIEEFLILEEKEVESVCIEKQDNTTKSQVEKDTGVWLDNMTASWAGGDQTEPTLNSITFGVQPGELIVIVGPVGSGKSSILMSILAEIPVLSGHMNVNGKIAYASQQAWSFAGTVRENVLFGSEFNDEKYKKVLHVCALEKDLQLFPNGDMTIVGERGVSLSGGQKARINLARALYCDADVYLLDDPLSAVDAAVSKHIFEKCIRGYLKDKVVLLVTHQLQFIRNAQHILVLRDGHTEALGTYPELVSAGIDFIKMSGDEKPETKTGAELTTSGGDKSLSRSGSVRGGGQPRSISMSGQSHTGVEEDDELQNYIEGEKAQIQRGEFQRSGSVRAAIYWLYVRSGSNWFWLTLLILSNIGTQLLFTGSEYFLSLWTDMEQDVINFDWVRRLDSNWMLIIFALMTGGLFLLSLVRTTIFFTICMRSSITLHNRLFESVIRAPISFFDNNPIGVLLNRCSRDLGLIDDMVPATAFDAVEIFVQLLGVIIMNAIIDPYLLIPTVILIVIFYYLRKYYITSARSVKRLEGITRSPVFSHLSNSLYGLSTVRAFGAQKSFERKFDDYQDSHTSSWFLFICSTRWFGILLDWLCWVYLAAVTITMIFTYETRSASEIGLMVSSAISLSGMFQWGVRQSAELESQMTSVERVDEYSHLVAEHNLESTPDGKRPPNDWPARGDIDFEDVSLQYNPEDPPVLRNLTFSVKGNEKIGIVGRTGAGKSSMIAALFRMSPPSGIIKIDGLDSGSISLADLRNKLSIIPQDPVLFAGPVRRNIDPFNNHTDKRLWEVLDEVRLKHAVTELCGGLEADIAEGGSNFSVGQRQLICLARAILKQNRILVLDEATANVDPTTDSLIQQTIRDKFADCTVLTIAHRLHTIMDSDKVLVLDAGRVVEYDEPYLLLQNDQGLFTSMVRMTGKGMAQSLKEMAKIAYDGKHQSTTSSTAVSAPGDVPYHRFQISDIKESLAKEPAKHDNIPESREELDEGLHTESSSDSSNGGNDGSGSDGAPDNGSADQIITIPTNSANNYKSTVL